MKKQKEKEEIKLEIILKRVKDFRSFKIKQKGKRQLFYQGFLKSEFYKVLINELKFVLEEKKWDLLLWMTLFTKLLN